MLIRIQVWLVGIMTAFLPAFVGAQAAHMTDQVKIGKLYCQERATGEGSWSGDVHVTVTDKPLMQAPAGLQAAPPSKRPGTKFIDYYFDGATKRGKWHVKHNDRKFYTANKTMGAACVRRFAGDTLRKHPLPRK